MTTEMYHHFATVLNQLLGSDTAIRLTVSGYMPLSVEDIGARTWFTNLKDQGSSAIPPHAKGSHEAFIHHDAASAAAAETDGTHFFWSLSQM